MYIISISQHAACNACIMYVCMYIHACLPCMLEHIYKYTVTLVGVGVVVVVGAKRRGKRGPAAASGWGGCSSSGCLLQRM